jgi:hypothetical protein
MVATDSTDSLSIPENQAHVASGNSAVIAGHLSPNVAKQMLMAERRLKSTC